MISILLLSLALQGSLDQRYREHNCAEPMNQADMNACAAIDFERADAELNTLWPTVIASARRQDAELDRRYDERPGYEQVVREAQRAWIAFRDSHCTWAGYEDARGGSMESMSYNFCRAELTRQRIRQLSGAPEPQSEQ